MPYKKSFKSTSLFTVPVATASILTLMVMTFSIFTYLQNSNKYHPTTLAATKAVRTTTELQSAINNAQSGDVIIVEDGSYNSTISISSKNGADGQPITIRARNRNNARFESGSQISIVNSSHITIEGFKIASVKYTPVLIDRSANIRISRNYFDANDSQSSESLWVYVKGDSRDIRIDHNDFRNKQSLGRFISVHGNSSTWKMAQNVRIDHNYFKNVGPRVENGKEALQIGLAEYTYSFANTIIEHNLFEGCNGDPEIISLKSSGNTVRHNTFRSNNGSLVLRHGNSNTIEGNMFVSTYGGIRVHGANHKIIGNYFESLSTGELTAPIVVPLGNEDEGSHDLKNYFRAVNTLISDNIGINNNQGIVLSYPLPATSLALRNTVVRNNIFRASVNKIYNIRGSNENTTWENNIADVHGTASVGVSLSSNQVRVQNTGLTPFTQDGGNSVKQKLPNLNLLEANEVGPESNLGSTTTSTAAPVSIQTPVPVKTISPTPILSTQTPRPSVTAVPTVSPTTTLLTIYAAGRANEGIYPTMKVYLNDQVVRTFNVNSTTLKNYFVTLNGRITPPQLKIAFENDSGPRDLQVRHIKLDDTTYVTTAPTVYSVGSWSQSNGCQPGYKQSEWLNCPGYFKYQ